MHNKTQGGESPHLDLLVSLMPSVMARKSGHDARSDLANPCVVGPRSRLRPSLQACFDQAAHSPRCYPGVTLTAAPSRRYSAKSLISMVPRDGMQGIRYFKVLMDMHRPFAAARRSEDSQFDDWTRGTPPITPSIPSFFILDTPSERTEHRSEKGAMELGIAHRRRLGVLHQRLE
jgi:hypothetical protein